MRSREGLAEAESESTSCGVLAIGRGSV